MSKPNFRVKPFLLSQARNSSRNGPPDLESLTGCETWNALVVLSIRSDCMAYLGFIGHILDKLRSLGLALK